MKRTRVRAIQHRSSILAQREPMLWLTGGALVLSLAMIAGLMMLIGYEGLRSLWPQPVIEVKLQDGKTYWGEVTRREAERQLVRIGNFEITGNHFVWVTKNETAAESLPPWVFVVERHAWGRFYGVPKNFMIDGKSVATAPEEIWGRIRGFHPEVNERWRQRRVLEQDQIGKLNHRLEAARLKVHTLELKLGKTAAKTVAAQQKLEVLQAEIETEFSKIRERITALNAENERYKIVWTTSGGQETTLALADIVRAYPANRLSPMGKIAVYAARWKEFLVDEPREANSEGGVFPAIFGTLCMTLIMSIMVVPFGVLAALYLREYAKKGFLVSAIRIAVNNLAGVPSIVFGVFGLGFFCYILGASVDELFFSAKLPNPTFGKGGLLWASLTLALLTLPVVIVATEEALAAVPNSLREGSYACGAGKWQTLRRIVLPRAMPGIMTGTILAMARGAGEVAPLMLVGAVKLAPQLPVDGAFPFVHPERSFMHLGFHIFDLGFQSQNSEAAKPMVFTTTLLLIGMIALLNLAAVRLRSRLRGQFITGHF